MELFCHPSVKKVKIVDEKLSYVKNILYLYGMNVQNQYQSNPGEVREKSMKTTTVKPQMMTWLRMTDYGSEFLNARAFTVVSDEDGTVKGINMITVSGSTIEIKFTNESGPVYAIVNVSWIQDNEVCTTTSEYDVQGYTIERGILGLL